MLNRLFNAARNRDVGAISEAVASLKSADLTFDQTNALAEIECQYQNELSSISCTIHFHRLLEKSYHPDVSFNYAYYLARFGQYKEACSQYQLIIEQKDRGYHEALTNLAVILSERMSEDIQAIDYLKQALAIAPSYRPALMSAGNISEQLGNFEEASNYFKQAWLIDRDDEDALARYIDTTVVDSSDIEFELSKRAPTSRNPNLMFSIGRYYERAARYDNALKAYERANEMDTKIMPQYKPEDTSNEFERLKLLAEKFSTPEYIKSPIQLVFIVGMFRSGSTLAARLLTNHSRVAGGHELELIPRHAQSLLAINSEQQLNVVQSEFRARYLAEVMMLSKGRQVFIDKRPDNFKYIGIIKALFPNAKILITSRAVEDIAASIYTARLGREFTYSRDLSDIYSYIHQAQSLIEYWQNLYGDFIRVNYEDLCANTPNVIKNILDELELEFEDDCVTNRSDTGVIKTESVIQARAPVHTNSIGRAARLAITL